MPGLACAALRRAAPRRIARADRSRRRKPGASPPASGDLPGAARPRMVGDERAVLGDVRRDPRTPGGVVALVMRVCRPPRPQQQQQHERPSMCHPRSPAPGPPLCRPRLPACVALLRATFPASWLPQHFCHTATPPRCQSCRRPTPPLGCSVSSSARAAQPAGTFTCSCIIISPHAAASARISLNVRNVTSGIDMSPQTVWQAAGTPGELEQRHGATQTRWRHAW